MTKAWVLAGVVVIGLQHAPPQKPPNVSATSALVMNANSGRILYAKAIHQRWPPGSLVKIMTAWLAIRYGWHKVGRVTPKAFKAGGASLGLPVGVKIPLNRLVPAMMMASGNDAAEVVAKTVAGSDAAFVRKMNDTAHRWDVGDAHFANPSGLPAKKQWTTAVAMGRLARRAMENPIFAKIVRAPGDTWSTRNATHFYINRNQLIGEFPGANGIKVGFTRQGGATLVATAVRHHTELIVVLLHDNLADVWPDASRLLDWGFSQSAYGRGQHAYPTFWPHRLPSN